MRTKLKKDERPYWVLVALGGGMWGVTDGAIPMNVLIGVLIMLYAGMSLAYIKGSEKA